jgi:Acetyltransferase (GNAT) domain
MMLSIVSPAPRDEWRAVVANDPTALPEHAPEWVDALCAVGPYRDASRYYQHSDGREFVLPMVRRTGVRGLGGSLLSYPSSWGIGGLVGGAVDPEIIRGVLADLRTTRSQRIAIRPDPLHFREWSAAGDSSITLISRRAHVIDLTGGADAVWLRMSRSARRDTRVAERAGVRIETDRTGALLQDYYKLFLLSVDRWADKQHEPRALAQFRAHRRDPLVKLQAMAEHLGKAFVVTLAYVDDQPIFGNIILLGQTAHDTRAAMDKARIGATRAGELVRWRTIQLACDLGCTAYHLGESGGSGSLAQYKEKFGAQPVDYAELRMERLPYTRVDRAVRSTVKRILRFRDV